MIIALTALLASASIPPLKNLNDKQLCGVLKGMSGKVMGYGSEIIKVSDVQVDCTKKVIQTTYKLQITSEDGARFVEPVMQSVTTGTCPTVRAGAEDILARGWHYGYTFAFSDGTMVERTLRC